MYLSLSCFRGHKSLGSLFEGAPVNVFVFVIVFVFGTVFFLVRSCLLITLIKCLKGHKSLGSLFGGAL